MEAREDILMIAPPTLPFHVGQYISAREKNAFNIDIIHPITIFLT
jgi:hypothetical protein